MKPPHFRSLTFVAVVAFAVFAAMPVTFVESDDQSSVPQERESSVATLRQLCRSGNAETSAKSSEDASVILLQQQRSRAACDHLVDAAGPQGRDRAKALLDRADLNAPGEGEAYRRALADYDHAISVAPDFADAYWRGKANILFGGNLAAALKDLDAAIGLDPSQAEFYVTRASIVSWIGDPAAAFVDLNRALSLIPDPCTR